MHGISTENNTLIFYGTDIMGYIINSNMICLKWGMPPFHVHFNKEHAFLKPTVLIGPMGLLLA